MAQYFSVVRMASAALLLSCLATCSLATGSGDSEGRSNLNSDVRLLGEDLLQAPAAIERLFEAGPAVTNDLIEALQDERPFLGFCGSRTLEGAREISDPEVTESFRAVVVGEAALYLIVARLKGDLYFAPVCWLEKEGKTPKDEWVRAFLAKAHVEITSRIEAGERISMNHVESLMAAHGASFEGRVGLTAN